MTLIDRHKPLLRAALRKIQEIEDVRRLFNGLDDKHATETAERLTQEYLAIIRQIQWETELTVRVG